MLVAYSSVVNRVGATLVARIGDPMSLKIGFIGVGSIAESHINILSKFKNVSLVSFCDVNYDRAHQFALKFNTRAYRDHKTMYAKEQLDAVYICIPPFAHTDQEIIALKKGINLFIEKPVTLSLKKALQIEQVVKKSKSIVAAGYVLRYLDIVNILKTKINPNKPAFVEAYYNCGLPPATWWTTKSLSGGQLIEQSTHAIDLIRYLFGDIKTVYAQSVKGIVKRTGYTIEDASMVTLKLNTKTLATLSSSCIGNDYSAGIAVRTEGVEMRLHNWATLKISTKTSTKEFTSKTNMYETENKCFIDAISKKDKSLVKSTYSDAVKTLKTTLLADNTMNN
jgi:predicted dehydrogenase